MGAVFTLTVHEYSANDSPQMTPNVFSSASLAVFPSKRRFFVNSFSFIGWVIARLPLLLFLDLAGLLLLHLILEGLEIFPF
jgi:hypothetical protein